MKRKTKKTKGTSARPRLAVFRSIKHIHAQVIDDEVGKTIVAASSAEKELNKKVKRGNNVAAAKVIGEEIAKRAVAKKVKKVVFDRGTSLYLGRVKALADAARQAGLEF